MRQARGGNAAERGEAMAPPSALGRAAGIWSRASGKLFSLEARIKDQVNRAPLDCLLRLSSTFDHLMI